MKGLLIKDFALLKNQRRVMLLFFGMAVLYVALMSDISFTFTFVGMMGTILALSTLSYDEMDHGQSFLFSLPFDRKSYVGEKFLFTFLLLLLSQLLAFVCGFFRMLIAGGVLLSDLFFGFGLTLCICMFFAAMLIPIRIRFGAEQGRIYTYIIYVLLALAAMGLRALLPDGAMSGAVSFLNNLSLPVAFAGLFALAALAVCIGYAVSVRCIQRKEY